ncbi:hypothetical protein TNCV_4237791 [Trichonephila clavipes]|nr:hypothetical protein TNCV_4237791 [Trichonephila clavipes]
MPCEAEHCPVEKWLLGVVARVATHVAAGCHGHITGLSRCHGSILRVTVYCWQWPPKPSHQLWMWYVAENKGWIEAFPTGPPHTNTIAITAEIESGFVAKDDLVPFHCSTVSSWVAPLQTDASIGGR